MTIAEFQRAMLAEFAIREAGHDGPLDQMKAIAMCMRTRVREGWWDADWIQIIEHAHEVAGNPGHGSMTMLSLESRSAQRMIREVDEIFFSRSEEADAGTLEDAIGKSCYWLFMNRPIRPWFRANIIEAPKTYRQRSQMGLIMFFETKN